MKNLLLIFSAFICLSAKAQKPSDTEAVNYVTSLITEGRHKYELLYQEIPVEYKDIINRSVKAMQRDKEWYNAYKEQHKNETPLPYHEKMGITKEEYDKLNQEMPKFKKMKVKRTEYLVVRKQNDSLRFTGEGNFTIFNAVAFDLKKNTLFIDYQKVPYDGPTSENNDSPFGAWQGHKWKYEVGDVDKAVREAGDYILFEVTIGKTIPDGKILMQFTAKAVDGGNTGVNATVSGYLD